MTLMMVVVNALLYVFALTLAVAVISPQPEGASRRARVARSALACGGGLTVTAAIALAFVGLWFESALAGTAAILVVGTCMWFGLARQSWRPEDDEDDDDDGGGRRRPRPPEPTQPVGGPPDDPWADFDLARAGWDRDREPAVL
jgi:L-lactate permease